MAVERAVGDVVGTFVGVHDRTLDSHIRRIRAKLRKGGVEPIATVHGLGFRLEEEP
ncbi:MAG: helix-turn-helix domain-containing protein, partial [Myxococcota bacterium]